MRAATRRSAFTRLLLVAVHGYQRLFSWYRAPACRFVPSCSQYAAEAIEKYGAGRGVYLAARRLLRCRPGGPFGFDPVPDAPGSTALVERPSH
ncbi:MAG TPA: membrane protein insertion efficiency factor YidD [Acidimicrobiales bacterium]|nr:membrane protein insertion efficiency factor YidD [Acidimicrobiales bacterium]